MVSISLCMIVKNEEDVIGRCLNSVKDIADEIIIVDTGSTDKTKEIVKEFTDKIYDFEWINDFSAARNYSYSKATKDFILWLDADDVIFEEDRIKFKKLKESLNTSTDQVMMKYNVGFDTNGNVNFSYYRERLSNRLKNFKWQEPVHECMDRSLNFINSDVCITHKKEHPAEPGRNLHIYEKHLQAGNELSPRATYYYARELYYNGLYDRAIEQFNKYLDGGLGWREDQIRACCDISSCYSCINDRRNMLLSLFHSFEYDIPRADVCCNIGSYYFDEKNYERAKFWYELAYNSKKPDESMGFIYHDCYGYIPCIQLCVCYDRLGNTQKAIEYNNKAAEFKPDDPSVIYNKNYFENIHK